MDLNGLRYCSEDEFYFEEDDYFSDEKLIEGMKYAKNQIEQAINMFNNVSDNTLIDIAIYSEYLARKKYSYLLSIARQRGMSVTVNYISNNNFDIV